MSFLFYPFQNKIIWNDIGESPSEFYPGKQNSSFL